MKTEKNTTRGLHALAWRHLLNRCCTWAGYLIVALGPMSCAGSLRTSDSAIDRHLNGGLGVQQACTQAKMAACDELRKSFERFVLTDFGTARQHIRNVLSQNDGLEMHAMTRTLEIAARIAGRQGDTVQQFSAFLSGVIEGNSPDLLLAEEEKLAEKTEAPVGCIHDSQCKFDRVCINGECISARYREQIEALYMATARGIVTPEQPPSPLVAEEVVAPTMESDSPLVLPDEGAAVIETELELLSSQLGQEAMLCTPEQVKECMKECEKGSAENCFAVGKLYEQLPRSEQNSEYMLFAYRKACAFGLNDACIDLGNHYFYGHFGESNMALAYRYNFNACAQGNGIGCVNIARLLKSGKGVSRNSTLADKYYIKACEYGQKDYCIANTGVEVVTEADGITVASVDDISAGGMDEKERSRTEKAARGNSKGKKKNKATVTSGSK
jgi:hypothetical protein